MWNCSFVWNLCPDTGGAITVFGKMDVFDDVRERHVVVTVLYVVSTLLYVVLAVLNVVLTALYVLHLDRDGFVFQAHRLLYHST